MRSRSASQGLGDDPLAAEDVLQERFFRPPSEPVSRAAPEPRQSGGAPERPKPTHYRVISISLYSEDLERLDAMVAELKRRGHTKANKSQLIRFALSQVDLDQVPRGI